MQINKYDLHLIRTSSLPLSYGKNAQCRKIGQGRAGRTFQMRNVHGISCPAHLGLGSKRGQLAGGRVNGMRIFLQFLQIRVFNPAPLTIHKFVDLDRGRVQKKTSKIEANIRKECVGENLGRKKYQNNDTNIRGGGGNRANIRSPRLNPNVGQP